MMKKLTIEEFRKIKQQLNDFLEEIENAVEFNKENDDFDEEEFEKKSIQTYFEQQQALLSYDLSDIPFEEWEGVMIYGDEDHKVDFSKAKANIDFHSIEPCSRADFKGCNIRNLEPFRKFINPKDFGEEVINHSNLFLPDSFPLEFKEKYYTNEVDIEDIAKLTTDQIEVLTKMNIEIHLKNEEYNGLRILCKYLGIKKIRELYNYSKEEYEFINQTIKSNIPLTPVFTQVEDMNPEAFIRKLSIAKIKDIKSLCTSYLKNYLIYESVVIKPKNYPKLFVRENPNLFLNLPSIPEDLKARYYSKVLTLNDVSNNLDLFDNIPVERFMLNSYANFEVRRIIDSIGEGNLIKILKKYPGVVENIVNSPMSQYFSININSRLDYEQRFRQAVKACIVSLKSIQDIIEYSDSQPVNSNGEVIFNMPEWIKPMNFTFVNKINTFNDLLVCTDSTVVLDANQQKIIDAFGIENIKKFQEATHFFTNGSDSYDEHNIEIFNILTRVADMDFSEFKDGTLPYDEFSYKFIRLVGYISEATITEYNDAFKGIIKRLFCETYPELFIDENAPEELKSAFYSYKITPAILYEYKDDISYLFGKDISKSYDKIKIVLATPGLMTNDGNIMLSYSNFIKNFTSRYGNEKFIKLLSKYGPVLNGETRIICINDEINNEHDIEKSIRKAILNKIINEKINYLYLSTIPEMVEEYPGIFVNFDSLESLTSEEKIRLETAFYDGSLKYEDIHNHPELVSILKDKNLKIAFKNYARTSFQYKILELATIYGNEKFLELNIKYGRYMNNISDFLDAQTIIKGGKCCLKSGKELTIEELDGIIEQTVIDKCIAGNFPYQPDDAPSFLKKSHPELFLSEDAPDELKGYFYCQFPYNTLTFKLLQEHKEWLPYLEGKLVSTVMLRDTIANREELEKYFKAFGEEKAKILGINKPETIRKMIESHSVSKMKIWYDKTGQKFIPDYVVMQNFEEDEIDKFLISGNNWSALMRIKSFSSSEEGRDAMLKLAYSFGAFDQDPRGFKKLLSVLTSLPRKMDASQSNTFTEIDSLINLHSKRDEFFREKTRSYTDESGTFKREVIEPLTDEQKEQAYTRMIDCIKNQVEEFNTTGLNRPDIKNILNLLENLKEEKVDIDFTQNIFSQIYRKNEDGSYTLTINEQNCPKSAQTIREILSSYRSFPMLTPEKAHILFGGFKLEYNLEFREFLLSNMDTLLRNPNYASYISNIQKQFNEIKISNSNRALTLSLAVSYVQANKYENVNTGNERVAEISGIAGYSQDDFNKLQQIYNYGKQRTFSSIPRIEGKTSGYTYEMLRLDDPLAMAIGTLSDCCQELGNVAENCMQHSMVDKNGRVFVVRDEEGNIVAQSWVWRNKDVLCFDNIEIPEKAFARKEAESSNGRSVVAEEVYSVYKQAADDLIEQDEVVFKELLESGKITQEQYDGLRLGKITVGLGYNDIAASLRQNAQLDAGKRVGPLPYVSPVKLSRGLYTNDSATQYILEEREDRKEYEGETLPVHSDTYIEYTDSNFSINDVSTLKKLEIVTKNNPRYLDTDVSSEEELVTELALNYDLNPDTTRIIMNPNFAIIYDSKDDKVKIGDLLFNTEVNNNEQQLDIEDKVVMQIHLALEQIGTNKEIDTSSLSDKQKEMFTKAKGLNEEIDIERGVHNGK